MPEFITNILAGIKQWVENKLEEITYVVSLHLNRLNNRLTSVENNKQDASDNNLNTIDKTLVGAINELLARIETLETRLNNQA